MKILIALCAFLAVSTARVVIDAEGPADLHLLGEEECTWGPSYWCENLKTAAGCNATKHCIKTVWKDIKVPEDNDNVCNVCKDMVQQARDQLESNQTQEDLKAVFEGSCKLIHIKPIVKECIKIVDQFIPDLVETVASQMNPSVVCSVAGLCNSARMDKLLQEYDESNSKIAELKIHSLEKDELEPDECSKCYTVATHMEQKLNRTPRDKMVRQMLRFCGELNSFSDACSATILTYFDTIYAHLQENFNTGNICHLSGQCSSKYHKHEDADKTLKVEIRPLSSVGMVDVNDDLPCKLCEQLVGHLRDLLVANTTEIEFEQVLKGLCKQTRSFATECTAIVDEYYPEMYEYLTKSLNSNMVCQMSGMCPAPDKVTEDDPIWPLLPANAAQVGVRIFRGANKDLEADSHEQLSKSEVEAMQLPIERLMPFPISESTLSTQGTETCALCEYVLHYLQDTMTNPKTEDKVKKALEEVCKKLPESIGGQCTEFIDVYGDAVVAILAQEIDPSQVCPMLRLCPTEKLMAAWESLPAKYMVEETRNKPSCPLCLLAMTQIYDVIKNNKTEANIQAELDKLCIHLPHSLVDECTQLVKGYSKELIEMLLADLTPQEICVFIKFCNANENLLPRNEFLSDKSGEITTNEIPDVQTSSDISEDSLIPGYCSVCELAVRFIDKEIGSDKDRRKIENAVHKVCNHLPKVASRPCNKFINKHGDDMINVITKDVSPKQVCTVVGACTFYRYKKSVEEMKAPVVECAVCKSVMSLIAELLNNEDVDNSIKNVLSKVCNHVPEKIHDKCTTFIHSFGQSIINLIKQHENINKICGRLGLCPLYDYTSVSMESSRIKRSYEKNSIKHCTWGPAYWCSTNETARECKAVEHCKENVWKADYAPPKQTTLSETEPNI